MTTEDSKTNPDEYVSGPTEEEIEEAYENVTIARSPEYNNNRCPECDMPFVPDQWDVRHLHGGDTIGETWKYTCPSCGEETIEIGT